MSAIGNATDGWPQGLMQGGTPWTNGTAMPPQWYPQTVQNTQVPWPNISHYPINANDFKSLTAYIRKLLACEPKCACAWCSASELERQVAIAQFFKDEPAEEPAVP